MNAPIGFVVVAMIFGGAPAAHAGSSSTGPSSPAIEATTSTERIASPPDSESPARIASTETPGPRPPEEHAESEDLTSVATPSASANTAKPRIDPSAVRRHPVEPVSDEELCDALVASARAHDVPIGFFGNLIWQESRFDAGSVSRAGAQGVAQFMPGTAAQFGLTNPFDPHQALPASARFLRQLSQQFGNFGLAAAAYNAGPGRVLKWLANRAELPRETRAYVRIITGRAAEDWRKNEAREEAIKVAGQLPCRHMPAFADLKKAEATALEEEAKEGTAPLRSRSVREWAAQARPRLFKVVALQIANRMAAEQASKVAKAKASIALLKSKSVAWMVNSAARESRLAKAMRISVARTTPAKTREFPAKPRSPVLRDTQSERRRTFAAGRKRFPPVASVKSRRSV